MSVPKTPEMKSSDKQDDDVASIKKGYQESIEYFGNKDKQERELWVLRDFISYIKPEADLTKVIASCQEPNDACYEDYGFRIKEVLSPGRKRTQEYKDKYNSITEQTELQDLLEPCSFLNIPLNEEMPYVASELERHRKEKYHGDSSNINVLVYLNLTDTSFTDAPVCDLQSEIFQWKSVSLVSNNHAIVLACSDQNNRLLYPLVGKLHFKNQGASG